MSKFIDKLNKLAKGEAQAIGFTARQSAAPKPKMQLVARIGAENAEGQAGHLSGADFGLIEISKAAGGAALIEKLSKSMPDIIWGGWMESGTQAEVKQLTKAGFDFIIFPANTMSVTVMKDDKETGKILELESTLAEGMLRTANELPVDAVLVDGELKKNQILTFGQMMIFTRFSGMLTKPLIVPVSPQVNVGELEALWEAGISAVVIEIEAKQPQDLLAKLKQEINKTEFPSRRSKRADALVPRAGQPSGRKAAEEDE